MCAVFQQVPWAPAASRRSCCSPADEAGFFDWLLTKPSLRGEVRNHQSRTRAPRERQAGSLRREGSVVSDDSEQNDAAEMGLTLSTISDIIGYIYGRCIA